MEHIDFIFGFNKIFKFNLMGLNLERLFLFFITTSTQERNKSGTSDPGR